MPEPVILLPVLPIAEAPRDGTWVLLLRKSWPEYAGHHPAAVSAFWTGKYWATGLPDDAVVLDENDYGHFSPLPDLSAPTDPEALASVLRAQGWVCSPRDAFLTWSGTNARPRP